MNTKLQKHAKVATSRGFFKDKYISMYTHGGFVTNVQFGAAPRRVFSIAINGKSFLIVLKSTSRLPRNGGVRRQKEVGIHKVDDQKLIPWLAPTKARRKIAVTAHLGAMPVKDQAGRHTDRQTARIMEDI